MKPSRVLPVVAAAIGAVYPFALRVQSVGGATELGEIGVLRRRRIRAGDLPTSTAITSAWRPRR
jgi:hypothetical protein